MPRLRLSIVWVMLIAVLPTQAFAEEPGAPIEEPAGPVEVEIQVPQGFQITPFASTIGQIRHMAIAENGWVYGALRKPVKRMGAVALYDADGDGVADEKHYFAAQIRGTGIGIYDGYLYYSTNVSILRWKLPAAGGVPTEKPELVAHGFNYKRQHAEKPFTFDGKGGLYVMVGAPSNACMEKSRTPGSPGMDPCPILEEFGGIWKFDTQNLMQHQMDTATLYATGIRNAMALDWSPYADSLYLVQHGRDELNRLFPDHFDDHAAAVAPAEEFHKVAEGADIGWPYSYFDTRHGKRMLMPEYGGDGKILADASKGQDPVMGFPAHWGPNDLLFKRHGGMPDQYSKGAFVAFYGSWDRSPLPEEGYNVVFVPMDDAGNPTGEWSVFADGFKGTDLLHNPRDAKHRPAGLAEGADGALYISSSVNGGHVWRVVYKGDTALTAEAR